MEIDPDTSEPTQRWGIFELTLAGPVQGNPMHDVELSAEFRLGGRVVEVEGFYDGVGEYRVRFSPDVAGTWECFTRSNRDEMFGHGQTFVCEDADALNHGPVVVNDKYHFLYADGTPYYPVTTTCYAWAHQSDATARRTLAELRDGPFNRLRMFVLPCDGQHNPDEPPHYPFELIDRPVGDEDKPWQWNWARLEPAFFRNLESRVEQLSEMGIEAELVIFHAHDRWGFSKMPAEARNRFIRYLAARLSAYRNVWWCLCEDTDAMPGWSAADWEHVAEALQQSDVHGRLRTLCGESRPYEHQRPWTTHTSVRHIHVPRQDELLDWRRQTHRPLLIDDPGFEGEKPDDHASLSAEELVHRGWQAVVAGAYPGHGEMLDDGGGRAWSYHGGGTVGEAVERFIFLRNVIEDGPPIGFEPIGPYVAHKADKLYLHYFGPLRPRSWPLSLTRHAVYQIDWIDPFAMTIEEVDGHYRHGDAAPMPARPYTVLRARRVSLA